MPKVSVIKNSFTGGEIGPQLLGRTDIAQYSYACETMENFLPRPYGSVISTPGTTYVGEVKDSTKFTRLIQFVFSRSDSYIIEMGEQYFRFYTDQAVVVSAGSATAYEITHVYDEGELQRVQYAQQNDVIYMAHPDHPPQQLTRLAANSWSMTAFNFIGGPFLDINTTAITITPSATAGSITITLSATDATTSFVSSGSTLGHVDSYWQIGASPTTGYVQITAVTSATSATALVINELGGTAATTNWAEGAWSAVRGYPGSVTFHENRLMWARTDWQPQNVWGSRTFTYDDYTIGADDDDALNLPLVSNESNEINWLASSLNLAAGTYGGEFIIESSSGPLTATTATAKRATSWGSSTVVPVKIGSFFYYVQRFGKKLRELFYFWDLDTYKSVDKTIFSPHIMGTGNGAINMAFQQNPDTVLWCVCTNGTIATLTREVDQEVQAWARQTTDGYYETVAAIPSEASEYDEVWTVVRREIDGSTVRYVEFFGDPEPPARQDMNQYLHSSLRFNAYDSTSSSGATLSVTATDGTAVVITASTAYFVSDDETQRIRAINDDGTTVGEAYITSVSSGTEVIADIRYAFSESSTAAGYWGLSVNTISGLSHLEAKEIKVLADGGMDAPDKTVSNGAISLAYDYFIVNCGLPVTQKLVTTPFEAGSGRGTAQGKMQKINEVSFKTNSSYKGFYLGGSEALIEQIQFRDPSTLMGTPESLYTGVLGPVTFNGDYERGAKMYIYNYDPLPVDILSIHAELTTYDK